MPGHLCPWWLTYTFDNPLRRLLHDPAAVVGPYVRTGMRVADIGCGMGFFTATLASLVGEAGRVQAVDLQPQQLARTRRRCAEAGVVGRVDFIQATETALGLVPPLDFVLAFWMVHEVADAKRLLAEVEQCLVPGGRMLVAEPRLHVSASALATTAAAGRRVGLTVSPVAGVRLSHALLLSR
jgi:ubiquinone/menaquinone biosynthesis C-methylase UbiE